MDVRKPEQEDVNPTKPMNSVASLENFSLSRQSGDRNNNSSGFKLQAFPSPFKVTFNQTLNRNHQLSNVASFEGRYAIGNLTPANPDEIKASNNGICEISRNQTAVVKRKILYVLSQPTLIKKLFSQKSEAVSPVSKQISLANYYFSSTRAKPTYLHNAIDVQKCHSNSHQQSHQSNQEKQMEFNADLVIRNPTFSLQQGSQAEQNVFGKKMIQSLIVDRQETVDRNKGTNNNISASQNSSLSKTKKKIFQGQPLIQGIKNQTKTCYDWKEQEESTELRMRTEPLFMAKRKRKHRIFDIQKPGSCATKMYPYRRRCGSRIFGNKSLFSKGSQIEERTIRVHINGKEIIHTNKAITMLPDRKLREKLYTFENIISFEKQKADNCTTQSLFCNNPSQSSSIRKAGALPANFKIPYYGPLKKHNPQSPSKTADYYSVMSASVKLSSMGAERDDDISSIIQKIQGKDKGRYYDVEEEEHIKIASRINISMNEEEQQRQDKIIGSDYFLGMSFRKKSDANLAKNFSFSPKNQKKSIRHSITLQNSLPQEEEKLESSFSVFPSLLTFKQRNSMDSSLPTKQLDSDMNEILQSRRNSLLKKPLSQAKTEGQVSIKKEQTTVVQETTQTTSRETEHIKIIMVFMIVLTAFVFISQVVLF